jgi:DnaD/phage-associated family protein
MSEQQGNYITEAMGMMGAGYDHPALEIEQERAVITRRNGKLTEEIRPAFVKISTAFKAEMKDIDPIALKVWLYIALSVNRRTGKAYPGLRKISEDCDLAINTIQSALVRLEGLQLLTVDRQSKRFNLYEPVDYVSANKADPSVSADDTDTQTVSDELQTVSVSSKTVSPRMIHNQSNQSKPDSYIDPIAQKLSDLKCRFNPNSANIIQAWKDAFPDEIILRAIQDAADRKKVSMPYIDQIIVSWQLNGIPPTREERAAQNKTKPKTDSRAEYMKNAFAQLQAIAAADPSYQGAD